MPSGRGASGVKGETNGQSCHVRVLGEHEAAGIIQYSTRGFGAGRLQALRWLYALASWLYALASWLYAQVGIGIHGVRETSTITTSAISPLQQRS